MEKLMATIIDELAHNLYSGDWDLGRAEEFVDINIQRLINEREQQKRTLERADNLKNREGITLSAYKELQMYAKKSRDDINSLNYKIEILRRFKLGMKDIIKRKMKEHEQL